MPSDNQFGLKRLYFLRLYRACKVFGHAQNELFFQFLWGTEAFTRLFSPEDFRLCLRSEKLRIMCFMWSLLSKYEFKEAARLLIHSLHTFPMAASWIWRVAFHIFRCLNAPESFRKFNKVLDQFRLADENNRVLERILHHMVQGDLDAAHKCRSHKVTHRDRYTSVESIITREPEFERVQRLQRLYEGLSLYCLWNEQSVGISVSDDHDHDRDQAAADELAEKAFHRLQEVEAMISGGYLCDVFIRPLVEILEYFGESARARRLLVRYKRHVPENPNTLRYLCEWYKRQHVTDQSEPMNLSDNEPVVDAKTVQSNSPGRRRLGSAKAFRRILTLRIQFSKHVLPEPAPALPSSSAGLSFVEEKKHLRAVHPHMSTIVICLKHGRPLDALELAFLVLDHPSWALYTEPWKLLKRAVLAVGKYSPEVSEAIRIRRRVWSRLHFSQISKLPAAANFTRSLFSKTHLMSTSTITEDPDTTHLGPLLSIEPMYVRASSTVDTSEGDTST